METTKTMRTTLTSVCLFLCFSSCLWAQLAPAASKAKRKRPAAPSLAARVQALEGELQQQRQQDQELREEMQHLRQALQQQTEQAQHATAQAETKAEAANTNAIQAAEQVNTLQGAVTTLQADANKTASGMQEEAKRTDALEHPEGIRVGNVTLKPGGFLEGAGIWRSHNQNGDVGSVLAGIPFGGSSNSHLSEFRGSARGSRLSLLAQTRLAGMKLSGYYELDFLGAATTANEIESNSFNPRQRQLWGQVEFNNGLAFVGGQTWSLITTNRSGLAPLSEFVPSVIDEQYNVGYNWARQTSARVTKKFNGNIWLAFALENPETTVSVLHGPVNSLVAGLAGNGNTFSPSSFIAVPTSTDAAPDMLAKAVFEPGWGHFEIKALGRVFRDRINPFTINFVPAFPFSFPTETIQPGKSRNDYAPGGGLGFAAIMPATKKFDVIVQGLGGAGLGRYASGGGADVTLRPDGTVEPIRTFHALFGLEYHPTPKWDLYAYGGNEYYARTVYNTSFLALPFGLPTVVSEGYGSKTNVTAGCSQEFSQFTGTIISGGFLSTTSSNFSICEAQNRDLWQVQPGLWYRFYKGAGDTLQLGMSYSYSHRSVWSGVVQQGQPQPVGIENTVLTSFRYYLP
jgi:hypothetical protein